jgi:hypothetical protein
MAKIWLLREGVPPGGNPLAEKPLPWCVDQLGLKTYYWLASQRQPPVIGRASNLKTYPDPRYVIVMLENQDATAHSCESWRRGYYLALISAEAVRKKLAERK